MKTAGFIGGGRQTMTRPQKRPLELGWSLKSCGKGAKPLYPSSSASHVMHAASSREDGLEQGSFLWQRQVPGGDLALSCQQLRTQSWRETSAQSSRVSMAIIPLHWLVCLLYTKSSSHLRTASPGFLWTNFEKC